MGESCKFVRNFPSNLNSQKKKKMSLKLRLFYLLADLFAYLEYRIFVSMEFLPFVDQDLATLASR